MRIKRFLRRHGKKFLIIIFLLIISGILLFFLLFKKEKPEEEKQQEHFKLGIVDYRQYNYSFGSISKNWLLASDGQKGKIIDMVSDYESDFFYNYFGNIYNTVINDYTVLEEDEKWILVDKNGNKKMVSEYFISILEDELNHKTYFYVYSDEGNKLYDENLNIIYDKSTSDLIYDDKIYNSEEVFNIKENKKEDIIYEDSFENYIVYKKDNKYYGLKKSENKEYGPYDDYIFGILSKRNENLVVFKENISWLKEEDLTSGLVAKKDDCSKGTKIKSKNNEIIYDRCSYGYDLSYQKNGFVFVLDEYGNIQQVVFDNGKVIDAINVSVVGDYLVPGFSSGEYKYYDNKGNYIENIKCDYLIYVDDGKYICGDGNETYFMDKELNKISSKYDFISCNEFGLCKIIKDNKYGFSIRDMIITEPIYKNVSIEENYVVIEDLFSLLMLKYDYVEKGLDFADIKDKWIFNDYKNIDTKEVVLKYELGDYEDLIDDNEELFQKYVYIAQNNEGVKDYLSYVIKVFPIIVQNKEYLDENVLLKALFRLHFYEFDIKDPNIAAYYHDNDKSIELKEVSPSVLYHEILHFLDFNFNNKGTNSVRLYQSNDDYLTEDEYEKLGKDEKAKIEVINDQYFQFITEAGAETYSLSSLNSDMLPRVYLPIVLIYNGLELIYGEEFMKEVFFSETGTLQLFKKMRTNGFTNKEIVDLLLLFDKQTKENYSINDADFIEIMDNLIQLYEAENNKKWYDDKVFNLFISIVLKEKSWLLRDSTYYAEFDNLIDITKFVNESIASIDEEYKFVLANNYFNIADGYFYIQLRAEYFVEGAFCAESVLRVKYNIDKDVVEGDYGAKGLCPNANN